MAIILIIFMKWEYHVVHLNVDDSGNKSEEASNPEAASEKLKGSKMFSLILRFNF